MKKLKKAERKDLNKKKNIIILNNTKGITLIALVITIIVLIILAGVSINLVLGDNGIVTKAKLAKEQTEQAKLNEEMGLNETAKYLEEMGTSGGTVNPPETIKTVAEVKGGDYFDKPTTIKDSNENLIKVPEGFKIAEDSGINVTEGIVIEDNDIIEGIGNNRGNQYVWVPVGTGIKKADGSAVDITLGRYTFADGTNDKDSNGTILAKGTPILRQNADNYTQEVVIGSYYKELAISRTGVASSGTNGLNATSRGKQKEDGTYEGIKSFIDSVKANGGYYIARYEASYGTDGKANSKVSSSYSATTAPTKEGALWNFVTQLSAATASRGLYNTATTDLVNSYAWDTAIIYIQNFSGDADYSYQVGKSIKNSLTNTGVNNDEVCKISDMSSNTREWTTEYTNSTNSPCAGRGGYYGPSNYYTCVRTYHYATGSYETYSFRAILYI